MRFSAHPGLLGLLAAIVPTAASAGIEVLSISNGATVTGSAHYTLSTATGLAAASVYMDTGAAVDSRYSYTFNLVDVTKTAAADDSGRPNLLRFRIDADRTQTALASGRYVLTAKAFRSSDSKYVPIASVGGSMCYPVSTSGNASCWRPDNVGIAGDEQAYAVTFTDGMEFGLYVSDICSSAYTQFSGNEAEGCAGTSIDPDSGTMDSVKLQFEVIALDANNDISGSAAESLTYYLKFQDTVNTVSCPTISASNLYFPGDTEIFVESDKFSLASTYLAPVGAMVVVADTAALDLTSTFRTSGNDIVETVYFGRPQTVGGFTNSTATTPVNYNVGFLLRDASGIVYNSCGTLSNVQTASIKGFLESGQCFIATAAYNDPQSLGVRHLRAFRDRVLMRSELGRAFTDFYYRNSPAAAEWLMHNPWLRPIVLLLLVPVQLLAWALMNPWLSITGFAALSSLVVFARIPVLAPGPRQREGA